MVSIPSPEWDSREIPFLGHIWILRDRLWQLRDPATGCIFTRSLYHPFGNSTGAWPHPKGKNHGFFRREFLEKKTHNLSWGCMYKTKIFMFHFPFEGFDSLDFQWFSISSRWLIYYHTHMVKPVSHETTFRLVPLTLETSFHRTVGWDFDKIGSSS